MSSKEEISGLSEEEMELIATMRDLNIKPRITGPEAVAKMAHALSGEPDVKREPSHDLKKPSTHYYPKFSIFYGEDGKGEVSWDTFKYEVMSVMMDRTYSSEQIMFGIRQSVKGKASDKIRRLGVGATPEFVIKKLDSDYGSVENKETALKNYYTCELKQKESVESYATRLEELFYKAVELDAVRITDTEGLKCASHNGLRTDLKQMSVYQRDRIKDYDEFKRELRKMESEMTEKPAKEGSTPCKPAVSVEKKEDNESVQMLKQTLERMDKIEKGQEEEQQQINDFSYGYSRGSCGRGRGRGFARGSGNPRGRGNYQTERPLASETFSPLCYLCN